MGFTIHQRLKWPCEVLMSELASIDDRIETFHFCKKVFVQKFSRENFGMPKYGFVDTNLGAEDLLARI